MAVKCCCISAVLLYTTDLETIMTPPANKLMILSSLVPKQIIDEGLADWHSAGGGSSFLFLRLS